MSNSEFFSKPNPCDTENDKQSNCNIFKAMNYKVNTQLSMHCNAL